MIKSINYLKSGSYFSLAAVFLICGCATRYVDRDVDKTSASDAMGDVVVYKSSDEFKTNPPTCLGILPMGVEKKEFLPSESLRKAIHAYLAPSGIALIPLQKIDQHYKSSLDNAVNLKNISKATDCDTLITGEIIDKNTRFWGVYSEVKIGATVRITRVSTGAVIWRGKHTAVIRDGGLPINPLSIIGGTISAGMNLSDEQITRTTNDLARRLVFAIPNLKYTDKDSDLLAKSAKPPLVKDSSQSVHAYITSIENFPQPDLIKQLTASITEGAWNEPSDRIVLSDYLLKIDPPNTTGMFANASARLELSQPDESLAMTNRLLLADNKNPEFNFLKGRALLQLNNPAEATEPILKAAGSENPKAMYFTALGLAYNQMGNHEYALASLTRSLKIDPDKPYVLMQQAIAYVGIGEETEAALTLKRCMVLSIIAKDHRNASRALNIFKSMNLMDEMSPEELNAIETKISSLLTTP